MTIVITQCDAQKTEDTA